MRLDKFIANSTEYSRSDAKKLIKSKRISINDDIVRSANASVHETQDTIKLDGQLINAPQQRFFMLNKPVGVVCTTDNSEHPTVIDLVDEPQKHQLQIVGRLDKDTTGLVLLTNDGQWNHRVTSPNAACVKSYHVTLKHPIKDDVIDYFHEGILLKSESKKTRPAELIITDEHHAILRIQEGKYHQVKRMFAAVGNRVTALHRQAIGEIELDSTLDAGHYRPLTPTEIQYFESP